MSLLLSPRQYLLNPAWARNNLWRAARAMPTLDLRFAENKSLRDAVTGTSPVTFTRASAATYIGSDGLIKSAAVNEPRFDHNPATGASLGLLIEEQRTNLLLHNRTLTNAAWTTANITAAKDQVGVDGASNSASSITATAGNGTILQAVTSASAARATSAYVRRITGTGTVEMTQDGGTTWTAVTATGSWTRVTIPSATVTNPSVGFRVVTSGDAIAVDYVQLETGAFSTSAIETTTATVTRNPDVADITGANFSYWYNHNEGSLYIFFRGGRGGSGYGRVVSHNSDRVLIATSGASNNFTAWYGGTAITLTVTGVNYWDVGDSAVAAYDATSTTLIKAQQSVTGNIKPSDAGTINSWALGKNNVATSAMLNGTISRLTYWPARLPNAVLQAITQ